MNSQISKRNVSLDITRLFALCCVVMIHTSSFLVAEFPVGSFEFTVGNVCDSFSRVGVPLFVMISGSLLLDEKRQKSTGDMLRAAGKTLVLLVVWSVIYAVAFEVVSPLIHGVEVSLTSFFKSAVAGQVHMWYLYMLTGLYIATPFLRSFVKKENKGTVSVYIAVSLLLVFFRPLISMIGAYSETVLYINTVLDKFHAEFFAGYAAYYLSGWYVVHIGFSDKVKKLIYAAGVLSVAGIIAAVQFTGDYENMYEYTNILIFAAGLAVFTALNSMKLKKYPKPLELISKLSFGMYIVHILINKPAKFLLDGINPVAHLALRFAIVFVLSFVISLALSKIPYVKKIIRV